MRPRYWRRSRDKAGPELYSIPVTNAKHPSHRRGYDSLSEDTVAPLQRIRSLIRVDRKGDRAFEPSLKSAALSQLASGRRARLGIPCLPRGCRARQARLDHRTGAATRARFQRPEACLPAASASRGGNAGAPARGVAGPPGPPKAADDRSALGRGGLKEYLAGSIQPLPSPLATVAADSAAAKRSVRGPPNPPRMIWRRGLVTRQLPVSESFRCVPLLRYTLNPSGFFCALALPGARTRLPSPEKLELEVGPVW